LSEQRESPLPSDRSKPTTVHNEKPARPFGGAGIGSRSNSRKMQSGFPSGIASKQEIYQRDTKQLPPAAL
jgi:hypothetical protein